MSDVGFDKAELLELCWLQQADELSPEGAARLEHLVAGTPTACDLYLRYAGFCASLEWSDASEARRFKRVVDRAIVGSNPSLPAPPIADFSPNAMFAPASYFSSGWPIAYLIATIVFGIGLAIGAFVHVSQPDQVVHQPDVVPAVDSQRSSTVVARVTGMLDCVWEDSGFKVQGGKGSNQKSQIISQKSPLHLGDTLALRSGLLEIAYDTGAKVILQGPVAYEVESSSGGSLAIGRLTARLEKKSEARGQRSDSASQKSDIRNQKFAVRTPTAVVTDLGTEFGVDVDAHGVTRTDVFVGTVEVAVRAGQGRGEPQVLRTGQAARVELAKVRMLPAESAQANAPPFVRVMPARGRSAAVDAYREWILSLQPTLYYAMERPQNNGGKLLLDSAPGAHHATLRVTSEFGSSWEPGRIGECLYFHGTGVGDCAIVPNYPKAVNSQLTVAAWVNAATRPASEVWPVIAANWGDQVHGQFCLGVHGDGDLAIAISDRTGRQVVVREGASHPVPLATWQHVAFVVDGTVVRLYRNGNELASGACDGLLVNPGVRSLAIGNKTDDLGMSVFENYRSDWHGRIDEFVLFDRTLPQATIRRLCSESPVNR